MENQTCRNCGATLPENANYCPRCSQKNTTGKINAWVVIKEFVSDQFNLESKTPRTIAHLFTPGKLTKEFFKGKHKSYIHPIQLFFVLGAILFGLLGLDIGSSEQIKIADIYLDEAQIKLNKHKAIFIHELDSLKEIYQKKFPDSLSTAALDSLSRAMHLSQKEKHDSMPLIIFFGQQPKRKDGTAIEKIAIEDIVTLSPKELSKKYRVKGFIKKFTFQQLMKILKNGNNFNRFLLGHIIWAVMLVIPLLSLFIKLIFFRSKKYFVEHLVFGFHVHAFAFLILTLITLISSFSPSWLNNILIFAIFAYSFLAIRNVYGQNIYKTILLSFIILITYWFIFTISVLIVLFISAILF